MKRFKYQIEGTRFPEVEDKLMFKHTQVELTILGLIRRFQHTSRLDALM